MAKKQRKDKEETTSEVEPRRHRRLRQKEAKTERWIFIGVGLTLGLVLILLLGGVVNEYVLKPRRPIASVNGEPISVTEFQRRLRFDQDNLVRQITQYLQIGQQFAAQGGSNPFQSYAQQLYDDLSAPERFSVTVLDNMIDEDLVRQLAVAQGVALSSEEIQKEIEKQFGYNSEAEPTPTPDPASPVTDTVQTSSTLTEEEFQQRYNDFIAQLTEKGSLTEPEFRQWIATPLIRERLQEAAPLEFDATEEQVKVSDILVQIQPEEVPLAKAEADALAKIQEVRARIEAGESFEDLAAEVSQDPGSAPQGGDLGWFGRGMMVPEFEDAAFALEPGELSQPVKTDFGYHLIMVDEVNEDTGEIKARHILIRPDQTPSEEAVAAAEAAALEKITEAKARIDAGESFADVAKEMSDDTTSAEKGGDLGWLRRGLMPAEFDDVAFSLEPGTVSDPVKTPSGYYLIFVEDKDPEREVDEEEYKSRRSQAFDEWFQTQRDAADIENNWSLENVPDLPPDLIQILGDLRSAFAASQPTAPPDTQTATPPDTQSDSGQ